jgi:hypothetical protein
MQWAAENGASQDDDGFPVTQSDRAEPSFDVDIEADAVDPQALSDGSFGERHPSVLP